MGTLAASSRPLLNAAMAVGKNKRLSKGKKGIKKRVVDPFTRIFTIGFTKRRPNQVKKTTYAQSAQVREIRRKMFEVVQREATSCDLKQLVQKLIPEVIGREIEKASQGIYPLQNVFVRKVKLLKQPKLDISKLMELHSASTEAEVGAKVQRTEFVEPAVLESV